MRPFFLGWLLLGACAPTPVPRRPNVVLVSIDTLRADHLGCYGYGRETSPFLDGLAARGVVFERAFAQSSWTLASHMSLFTGRYPHNHGVETPGFTLPSSIPTLTECLKAAGYHTYGFVTWAFLGSEFGFGRGFDLYRELVPPPDRRDVQDAEYTTDADEAVDTVLAGLARNSGGGPEAPFFLFVHLFDPHMDYAPPLEDARLFDPTADDLSPGEHETLEPFMLPVHEVPERIPPELLEKVIALYDGEIRFTDRQLARLFDALRARGLLEDTLVVVTSDHGEELDDHGSMEGHGWTLYDEILRVPLIVVLPDGERAGERVEEPCRSIDVAATILELTGLPVPDSFDGSSLVPEIAGGPPAEEARIFSSSQRFLSRWAVRTEDYKLIQSRRKTTRLPYSPPEYELYDLAADPGEKENLFETRPEVARRLKAYLDAWRSTVRDDAEPVPLELDEAQLERIRAIGYADEDDPPGGR